MSAEFTGFRPAAFTFLRNLARHNDREWFTAHRHVYDTEIHAPLVALVEEVDVRLATIAPEIVGHPKRSLFRIHRDVRFSNDKSPYKTHVACWFHHRDVGRGPGTAAPHGGGGFYFHMEAGRASLGGGIWMPPPPALRLLRQAIDEDPGPLLRILREPKLKRKFGSLAEENMLTRMPRGFPETHPGATLLRHRSFTVGHEIARDQLESATLPDILARDYAVMVPFVRWIDTVFGLRPLAHR